MSTEAVCPRRFGPNSRSSPSRDGRPRRRDTEIEGPDEPLSAVVLSGGRSRRLGRDKALISVAGRPLIARVVEALLTLTDDVIVVSNRRAAYRFLGVRVVPDHRPVSGPLGGIAAGLGAAGRELAIVTACDMPFLDPAFLRFLAGKAKGFNGAVPLNNNQYEPLHAVYRRTCLPAVERRLAAGERQAFSFFMDVGIRTVAEAEWREIDPEGRSLVNLNAPEELERYGIPGGKR